MAEPPHNFEVEQSVLGALMAVPHAFDEVAPILRAEHFSDPLHGRAYDHIRELRESGQAANPITLKKAFNGDPDLERAGGERYLIGLMTSSLRVVAPARSAQLLVDLHRRRQVIDVASQAIEAAYQGKDYGELARTLAGVDTRSARDGGGLPLRFWDDLGETMPPDRLVRGLLGTTALAMIFGPPACGKSFLAVYLGLHIALGRRWFGRTVTAGSVVYVAGEGIAGINNRLAGFKLRYEPGADVPFVVVPLAVNLGPEGQDADRVIAAAAAVEARTGQAVQLVIVDTLARAMGHGDENSAQDMGAFIAACDRIRLNTGATVLIVHHTGKTGNAARGSSALLGAVDTAIEVEKNDSGRVARVVKQKDSADGLELGFDLEVIELGQDDEGEAITTCVVCPTEAAPKDRPKRRDPSGNAGVVFRALQKALNEGGETVPGTTHIPASARVVSVELWRRYAYQMMSDATVEARQKAFKRAHDQLVSTGYVSSWGSYAWSS